MFKKIIFSLLLLGGSSVFAHFQMIYTPELALNHNKNIPLRLVFTHPFTNDHTMEMGLQADGTKEMIKDFFVIHKDVKTNLKDTLKEIKFTGKNVGIGYQSDFKIKSIGDYVFVLDPAPYYEKNEDGYIEQITKVIVNLAGVPTDWNKEFGLKAEIVPLTKPYAIWKGGSFSGIVKSSGKPVPFAEIEVEYLNFDIDLSKNSTSKTLKVKAPQDSFKTLSIIADQNGKFTFSIPKAGWWVFAAIGVGEQKEYKGKELSQDALIWVQAKDIE